MLRQTLTPTILTQGYWDVLGLGGVLLRFCRAHRQDWYRLYAEPRHRTRFEAESRRFADFFRDRLPAHTALVDPAVAKDLSTAMETVALAWGSDMLAVRAAAEGLDRAKHTRFLSCLEGQRMTLAPGSPIPVMGHPVKDMYGKRLCANPARFDVKEPDATDHLRILPGEYGEYEVALDARFPDMLQDADLWDRVAIGVPSLAKDLLWPKPYDRDGQLMFLGIGPKDSAAQRTHVRSLIDAAKEAGASVLVLPELCTDLAGHDDAEAYFRADPGPLRIVVAGSRHVKVTGAAGANVSRILIPGEEAQHHEKFVYFDYKDEGSGRMVAEDIETYPRHLTLYLSADWSLAVLICKDLLSPSLIALLQDLRVRMVLVSAYSEDMQPLQARASQLATELQAIVVIANVPKQSGAVAGVVARPLRTKATTVFRAKGTGPWYFDQPLR